MICYKKPIITYEQIDLLLLKIKEKEGSNDKTDLFLVKHWRKQIEILKQVEINKLK